MRVHPAYVVCAAATVVKTHSSSISADGSHNKMKERPSLCSRPIKPWCICYISVCLRRCCVCVPACVCECVQAPNSGRDCQIMRPIKWKSHMLFPLSLRLQHTCQAAARSVSIAFWHESFSARKQACVCAHTRTHGCLLRVPLMCGINNLSR